MLQNLIGSLNAIVWGAPALIAILGVGIWFSLRTRFCQLRLLPVAVKSVVSGLKRPTEGVSPFQALCTALAATVGTGNIAGVAAAIALGGPGAIFWMWVCAVLGMGIKFMEVTLAVRYRQRREDGYEGGTMYVILRGMRRRWKPLALAYAAFGTIAAIGMGSMVQVNAMTTAIGEFMESCRVDGFSQRQWLIGLLCAALLMVLLSGGAKRVGAFAELLVPFMSVGYVLLALGVLVICHDRLVPALGAIVTGAFCPRAATGGLVGSAFLALRTGVSNGVFTNEAGLGTASMAHAGAQTDHPCRQGLYGIFEVFVDTIVICTITALVILCSGIPIPYGESAGAGLTISAFVAVYGSWVTGFLALAMACFALGTMIGWGLYGIRCVEFLTRGRGRGLFMAVLAATTVAASVVDGGLLWTFCEMVNGLMSIPNLISLFALRREALKETREFTMKVRQRPSRAKYEPEYFHQCQSL